MNNRRVGSIEVMTIIGLISAIAGIASMEKINSLKKDTESGLDHDYRGEKCSQWFV